MLFALTIHEFSHGYVAYLCGDMTAAYHGRLTFNPLKHIDPIGFIALIVLHIGWAKPVPVNPHALRNPRRDALLVALAGPASNIATAIVSAFLLKLFLAMGMPSIVLQMIVGFVYINVALGIFNLIPLPPLDGWRIVEYFWRNHPPAERLFPLTLAILLIVMNFVPWVIMGPIRLAYKLILHIFGIW
ncbi:MAG: site-2 protease family protein [Candidatus Hydrothermota bacterium]|nr:MAG: site-2 protease family protein [Candidatus Hydrothermae bacterium]